VTEKLRHALMDLHGAIVANERQAFERKWGRVQASEFLHQLIEDEAWSWLRPLSALIVQIDSPEEGGPTEEELLSEARRLIRPDAAGTPFQQRYASLVQDSPEVAYAHGVVMQALRPA
jgi:hypothetical protein